MRHVLHSAPRAVSCARRRSGVSLVTVLLSVCAVALLAVIAIPLYFSRHDVTLDAACRLLARDLRSVQNRAAVQKVGVRLVFDSDGWKALDTSGQPVEGLGEDRPILRRFSADGVFEGIEIREIELGSDSALAIDVRGLVSESGELTFVFGSDRRRVEIERGSGQVLIYTPGDDTPDEARLLK